MIQSSSTTLESLPSDCIDEIIHYLNYNELKSMRLIGCHNLIRQIHRSVTDISVTIP